MRGNIKVGYFDNCWGGTGGGECKGIGRNKNTLSHLFLYSDGLIMFEHQKYN